MIKLKVHDLTFEIEYPDNMLKCRREALWEDILKNVLMNRDIAYTIHANHKEDNPYEYKNDIWQATIKGVMD